MDERPTFSRNLVQFRKLKNLTQDELAKLSGMTRRVVAYYETEATDPPASILVAFSRALGVSIEELLSEKKATTGDSQVVMLDARTYKKLAPVATLTPQQRLYVYKMIDSLVRDKKSDPPPSKDLPTSPEPPAE